MWDIVLLYTNGYLVFKHNMVSQKVLCNKVLCNKVLFNKCRKKLLFKLYPANVLNSSCGFTSEADTSS